MLTGLVPGATYQITGHLMLTTGEAATNANFTVDRSDPGCSGGTCFDTVGPFQVAVTDSAWAQIGGTYTVSTTATSMISNGMGQNRTRMRTATSAWRTATLTIQTSITGIRTSARMRLA